MLNDLNSADAGLKLMEEWLIDPKHAHDREKNEAARKASYNKKLDLIKEINGIDFEISQFDPNHLDYATEIQNKERKDRGAKLAQSKIVDKNLAEALVDSKAKESSISTVFKDRSQKSPPPEKKPNIWKRSIEAVSPLKRAEKTKKRGLGIGEDE